MRVKSEPPLIGGNQKAIVKSRFLLSPYHTYVLDPQPRGAKTAEPKYHMFKAQVEVSKPSDASTKSLVGDLGSVSKTCNENYIPFSQSTLV